MSPATGAIAGGAYVPAAPAALQEPVIDWSIGQPYHGATPLSWVPVLAAWAASIAKEYGLPEPEGVWRLPRPEASGLAFLILSGGNRYALRLWRVRDSERVALLEVFRAFAVDHGLPGPASLKTREQRIFCMRPDRLATLLPYVEGETFRGDVESLQAAAGLQARFHQTSRHFPLAPLLGNSPPHSRDAVDLALREKAEAGQGPFDASTIKALQEAAAVWPKPVPDPASLPRQAGHFDWGPHTVVFHRGKAETAALFDYDLATMGERALDVALGMYRFASAFPSGNGLRPAARDEFRERCRIYLRAYHKVEQLSPAEIEAIPYLLFAQARRNIHFLVSHHYRSGDFSLDGDLDAQRAMLREALALAA